MSELKRTVLYQAHLDAGATMVDFGGWDMPIQYPDGIVAEHLYCRSHCAIFDVSHMGRIDVEGPDMVRFLQHVLSSNVQALDINQAQYCIIPNQNGCAIDDAYLYRFEAEKYFLVINAGNIDKDLAHLTREAERYNVTLTNVSDRYAAIAVQGPEAKKLLMALSGGKALTRENVKNALGTLTMEDRPVRVAKTGYTGEPIGYELYCESRDARYFWDRLIELGARPTALGARDTLRMEASLPLYGHEMGECEFGGEIPVYAVPLAKFAVSFAEEKGDFIGRAALKRQFEAFQKTMNRDYSALQDLPYRIQPVYLAGKGVLRKGFPVYSKDAWAEGKPVGYVTSGTMIPYFKTEGEGLETVITSETGKRSIGLAYLDSRICQDFDLEIDIRGKRQPAKVVAWHIRQDAAPYVRPILPDHPAPAAPHCDAPYAEKAAALLKKAQENHLWRQHRCINLIPSENTQSRAVRLLSASDPSNRYAEHKKQKAFYDAEIFYYQGTKFIDEVERLLVEQGVSPKDAREMSTQRVFGGVNGMYGTGIQDMITSGDKWTDEQEIADAYINNMGAVYGSDEEWGEMKAGLLRAVLHNTDAVVQPRQSNTWGALSLDHVYEFMGGMNLAVRNVTGKDPDAYFADYRNRNNVKMQELKEAIGVESRATIFNPEYVKEVMKGGASSASQITEVVTNTYGWNVTKPDVIDKEMWDRIYDVYVEDSYGLGTEQFFRQQNPAALQEITAVMLETARKGMWKASEQQLNTLASLHTELVEEFGSTGSGFSGGNAKLQEFIAGRVAPQHAAAYKQQIQTMKTVQSPDNKNGMVLKKDEVSSGEQGRKNALNGVWIAGGVLVLFVVLLLVLRKKRKDN